MRFKIHLDNKEHVVEAAADGTLMLDGRAFQGNVNGAPGRPAYGPTG